MTDDQWQQLEPLLAAQKPKRGRPGKDHRTIINRIMWVLRTGAPWRDLPQRYGPCPTVASRFYRWRKQGLWDRLLAEAAIQPNPALWHMDAKLAMLEATNRNRTAHWSPPFALGHNPAAQLHAENEYSFFLWEGIHLSRTQVNIMTATETDIVRRTTRNYGNFNPSPRRPSRVDAL